jgi:hypothetical protein
MSELLLSWVERQLLTELEARQIRAAVRARARNDDFVASQVHDAVAFIRQTITAQLWDRQARLSTAVGQVAVRWRYA